MKSNRRVRDERGVTYTLTQQLAEGGQGVVFATTTRGLVVKVRNLATPEESDRIRRRLDLVRRLGLSDLDVVVPASRLVEPDVGYVMEQMTGMSPIGSLTRVPDGDDPINWYCRMTGGVRRRLILLAALARTLASLNARGLAYGDVSPTNLWVSEDASQTVVRLIDLDNVVFFGTDERTFTPHYGAPELELGDAFVSSLSDAYAFAVLAFEVLTLVHPLYGDLVVDGDPELEVDARRGALPWIDDPNDRRNATDRGLSRTIVLTKGLQRLTHLTFADGRGTTLAHRMARPGLGAWADELEAAADRTIICPGCRGSYFVFSEICPFCGQARPSFVDVEVCLVQPDNEDLAEELEFETGPQSVARLCVTSGETRTLLARHAFGRGDESVVELSVEAADLRLRRGGDRQVDVIDCANIKLSAARAATPVSLKGLPIKLAALPDYALSFGENEGLRRIARFVHFPRRAS